MYKRNNDNQTDTYKQRNASLFFEIMKRFKQSCQIKLKVIIQRKSCIRSAQSKFAEIFGIVRICSFKTH